MIKSTCSKVQWKLETKRTLEIRSLRRSEIPLSKFKTILYNFQDIKEFKREFDQVRYTRGFNFFFNFTA